MKRFFTWPVTFEKVEFWAATLTYFFSLFFLGMEVLTLNRFPELITEYNAPFLKRSLQYSPFVNYFLPSACTYTAFYLSFSLLNFYTVKNIINKKAMRRNIALSALIIILLWATLAITNGLGYKSYILAEYKSPLSAYKFLLQDNFKLGLILTLGFIFYTFIKHAIFATIKAYKPGQFIPPVIRDCLFLFGIWIICVALMPNRSKIADFAFPITLYWFAYVLLIPSLKRLKKAYWVYGLCSIFISIFALYILHGIYPYPYRSFAEVVLGLNFTFIIYVMLFHAAWFFYHYRARKKQLTGLESALSHSSANLDLLRSQINPHFLFNALNTLYGTALHEEAPRTGEGIQKLGDMMRFMLHDNTQETIPLNREVDYLNNYISLQKLRTQTSPDIVLQTEIDEQFNDLHIVPMLLIPFVENAFKHGISLREPSFIKITLHVVGNRLYFDVHNSIHIRPDNDPEKHSSGIGLENVKQRLELLYPERHELTIRETAKEFFIHLTIEL